MEELFENIRPEVKDAAQAMWQLALTKKDPIQAAKFINDTTNYLATQYTPEEVEFLRFYVRVQLEMMMK